MKLVVTGATGFIGTEVIKQSLSDPRITSVIALARREVKTPSNLGTGADASKLKSIPIKDYDNYSDEVKSNVADADACIWTVAITPTKSKSVDFNEVRRVCYEHTLAGLKMMVEARRNSTGNNKPFRFMYISGASAERDQTKTPTWMPQYCLLRGETETAVLEFSKKHEDQVEACVARPGIVLAENETMKRVAAMALRWTGVVPKIENKELAVAMLDQIINGFEKDPLENDDLVRVAQDAQKKSKL